MEDSGTPSPSGTQSAQKPPKVSKPRRVGRVTQYEIDGEVVLYDPSRDRVHTLNNTAAVIWQLCDGSRTIDELTVEMAELYEVDPGVVELDVPDILEQLGTVHLLRHAVQNDA